MRAAQQSSPSLSRRSFTRAHGWARPTRWRPGPRRPRSWPQSSVRPSRPAAHRCTPLAPADAQSMAPQRSPGAWTLPGSQLHAERSESRDLPCKAPACYLCSSSLAVLHQARTRPQGASLVHSPRGPVHGCACVRRRRRGAAVPRAARGGAARRVCGRARPARQPRRRGSARAALPEQPPERRAARGPPQLHQGHCARPRGGRPRAVSCSRFCLLLRAAACVPREPLTPVQALLSNHKHGEPHHAGHHVNQVAPVSCGACVRSERMCPNYCLCMGCPRIWRRGACSLRRQPCLTRERPPCRSATWPRITNRPGARARSFPPACAACRGLGLARRAGSGRYFCTVHWAQFLARAGRLARGRPLSAGRRRRAALRPDEPSCPT